MPAAVIATALAALAAVLLLGQDSVRAMLVRWQAPEYSHGPALPLLVLYLLALRARPLAAAAPGGSWPGVVAFGCTLAVVALGERAALPALGQYGLVLAILALAWAAAGRDALRVCAPPLLLLFFMVPLPLLLDDRVTSGLQAVTAGLGVEFIRLAGYRAFRAGHVIDLGGYQLLVAEACSGLRYLFPLLGFGALCALLFRGRWWQRWLIVLATIPVAILMNSLRVGLTGILVNRYGPAQAEGFLHYFEGWVIFMACVLVLFGLLSLLARAAGRELADLFAVDVPARADLGVLGAAVRPNAPGLAAALLALVAAVAAARVEPPREQPPPRASLASLPRQIGSWQGSDLPAALGGTADAGASDRLLATFTAAGEAAPVELRIAWCASQRAARCGPSPALPPAGDGWVVAVRGGHLLGDVGSPPGPLPVNRLVLVREDDRQLVYYWYAERGRRLRGDFAREWYLVQDGLRRHRTDGALVRVATRVTRAPAGGPDAALQAADRRLEAFVRQLVPELGPHLPD